LVKVDNVKVDLDGSELAEAILEDTEDFTWIQDVLKTFAGFY
jgi:hypothetical protein